MGSRIQRYKGIGFIAVIAAILPLVLPGDYAIHLATVIGINTIVVLGLNLLMGYAGQVSLGQAAFVGIGAYASGILTIKLGLSPWIALAAGVTLTSATGFIVGVPLLKLRGHYLAMGTLGFGMIVQIVLTQWESLTEGTIGIMSIPPLTVAGFPFKSELSFYYLVAFSVILSMSLAANIIDSRVGRAMRAVHGSEVAAETSGVDTARYKLQVFVLSAAMAGYAGSLYAHHATYIHPGTFGFHQSIQLVVMAVLGGMASIWGAVFGAGAVTLIAENLRAFQEFSTIVFGGVLIIIMIFMPAGLWRGTGDVLQRLWRLRHKPAASQSVKHV
ncbi:MAG: branched-chain amino acid ABC transporter permease [Armatimonadetes bacterium]|nr:branched-chain amino acid ABC transporter permease [Armatimonadota bacterium]